MTTNTIKVGIDFDGIFVRDIPNFRMSDDDYLTRIKTAKPLKLKNNLLHIMDNCDWYIITGRKKYLKEITLKQLRETIPESYMQNFKGIHFKFDPIPDYKFKIAKCKDLGIELYIESEEKQAIKIAKGLHCVHYKEL